MRIEDYKIVQSMDKYLRKENGLKKAWINILVYSLVILLIPSLTLILFYVDFNVTLEKIIHTLNRDISDHAVNFSYATFGIITIPYLFLAGTWVAQINNVWSSKYFHLFVWANNLLTLVLGLVGLGILFSSFVVRF